MSKVYSVMARCRGAVIWCHGVDGRETYLSLRGESRWVHRLDDAILFAREDDARRYMEVHMDSQDGVSVQEIYE